MTGKTVSPQYLVVLKGHASQRRYPLEGATFEIGPQAGCQLQVSGPEHARVHLNLRQLEGRHILMNMGMEPVMVNDRQVMQTILSHKDQIKFGKYQLTYEAPGVEVTEADPAGAPPPAKARRKGMLIVLLGIYLLLMTALGLYLMLDRGEPAERRREMTRINLLDAAGKSHIENRDRIFQEALRLLQNEPRLDRGVLRKKYLELLDSADRTPPEGATPPAMNNPTAEPLRQYLINQINRISRSK